MAVDDRDLIAQNVSFASTGLASPYIFKKDRTCYGNKSGKKRYLLSEKGIEQK